MTVDSPANLRHAPTQARSRERLQRVLDAADDVLAGEGAAAFTTTRVAERAGVPVGSVYRFFDDKEAIVEALAIRYWAEFEALVTGLAEDAVGARLPTSPTGAAQPASPSATVLEALAAGFRARPGFLALWYGGLRSERVRAATRPARMAITSSVVEILRAHWPAVGNEAVQTVAEMVVLAGDGLLREAFRRRPDGDAAVLAEAAAMLDAYLSARLG
jgi:AcrR family transcriptional regulator